MKKILVLSHSSSIGGGELALRSLIESTIADYDWTIAFPTSAAPDPAILPDNVQVEAFDDLQWWCHEVNEPPRHLNKTAFKRSYERLSRLAKDYDVLVTNTLTIPWLGFIAQQIGKPHIWYVHEFGDIDHNLQFIAGYETSLKLIDECSSRVLTISDAVRSHIGRVINPDKIDIIHQSVDFEALSTIPLVDTGDAFTSYLAMGAIKPSKGQKIAANAFTSFDESTLDIIGPAADGSYVEDIKNSLSKGSRVKVETRRYNPKEELLCHQVVLMCSENEGLGRVTLEALAAGRVVVGYDCPSTRELLGQSRGVLYSPNTPEALNETLRRLPALTKNINLESARSYVVETYSDTAQSLDFTACVNRAFAHPIDKSNRAYCFYIRTIAESNLWQTNVSKLRKKVLQVVPSPTKRLLKRLVGEGR